MKVLITGGAGFIGSHLTERLLSEGCRVRILDNLSTGKRENLPLGSAALDFHEGDIRNPEQVRQAMADTDAVVHLAAVASVQASVDDPVSTHASNFDGTLHLLEAARRSGTRRFLYASSAAVYGDTRALPVSEETPLDPLSPYAADKLAGEHYLKFYSTKHGLNTTAFRFFNIYGPRQDPSSPYSGVISIFTDRLRAGQGVTLFGDGSQTRDFVFVQDLAEILALALKRTDLDRGLMNVGTGRETSLLDLLAALEQLAGCRIERNHQPARVGDILKSRADIGRLLSHFGSPPATSLLAGLGTLVD